MTSDPLLVGVDIGTTTIKALVFDTTGKALARASVQTPTHHPRPEWAYYDPEELWQSTVQVIQQAISQLQHAGSVASIAVASIGETGVPLNAQGKPTYEAIAWFDQRPRAQIQFLEQEIGRDSLFALTGLPLQPIFSLCKILWLKDQAPDAFAATTTWLNTADYIAYRLSGVAATDYSLASRTLALDIRQRQWATHLLDELKISPSLFAPLQPSGTALGKVLPEIAQKTGLPAHTRVATGGHDHICGALAVGVNTPGTFLNSLGTAEAFCLPLDEPITDPQIGRQGFTVCAHVAPDKYYMLGGLYTSGACIDWFRNLFGQGTGYDTLITEAEASPPGGLGVGFLPHLRLANPPYDDPQSRGAFVGLNTDIDRGNLFRAVLEGLAYESRQVMDTLLDHARVRTLQEIKVIGGGIRNTLLMQIKASVLDQPITLVEQEEATALGAALLGGLGADVFPDLDTALGGLQYPQTRVLPKPEEVAFYQKSYSQLHQDLYPTLQKFHHTIDRIQHPD